MDQANSIVGPFVEFIKSVADGVITILVIVTIASVAIQFMGWLSSYLDNDN